MKAGARGQEVKTVQRKVGAKESGHFDQSTKQKVMAYQRAHGLQVDGAVGTQTATAVLGGKDAKKVKPGPMSAEQKKGLAKTAAGKRKARSGRRGKRRPGGLPGKQITEAYNPGQPRDRMGRWRRTVGRLHGLKAGEKVKVDRSFEVTKLKEEGPRKYRVTMRSPNPTHPEQHVYADTAAEAADAAHGVSLADAEQQVADIRGEPHPFEQMVSAQVKRMKGSDPSEKGMTSWRRHAFLTVRTAMGRKDAGISLEHDHDWKASLDWWDKRGRRMLAEDPEMQDYLKSFGDETPKKMVRQALADSPHAVTQQRPDQRSPGEKVAAIRAEKDRRAAAGLPTDLGSSNVPPEPKPGTPEFAAAQARHRELNRKRYGKADAHAGRRLNETSGGEPMGQSPLDMLISSDQVGALAEAPKTYTAEERRKATTMKDESFPIDNKADLGRAISSYGRAKDKAKAKAWIIRRAKALGATSMLPEPWKKNLSEADTSANGSAMKGGEGPMNKVRCPKCQKTVTPTKDGKCPTCGTDLKKQINVAKRMKARAAK